VATRKWGFLLRHRSLAYIGEDLFQEYLSKALIPYVANLSENPVFGTETVVLVIDLAPAHRSERALRLPGENRILAVVFPDDTTRILQALDLVFFGALKKLRATAPGERDESSMNDQIQRLLQAYEQTGTSMAIKGSFIKASLYLDLGSRPFRVRFDEEKQ
jgi:hypothetical protein